ncbi:MAG: hypothetical protein ABSF59_01175 [Candidatus Sulfotelmatobacter sp.]|jgi:hypothetical protein
MNRKPTQFAIWQAEGWAARGNSWGPALGITAFLWVAFAIAGDVGKAAVKPALAAPIFLGVFYLTIGFVSHLGNWVIEYNLNRQPSHTSVLR